MRNIVVAIALSCAVALQPSPASADSVPPAEQRIELSLADLLNIYSQLATLTFADVLVGEDFVSVQVMLLNADGRTVMDFVVNEDRGRRMQAEGAGEATKSLLDLHALFAGMLRDPASSQVLLTHEGDGHLRPPATPASKMVRAFLKSRTDGDFLTQVRFERDGKKHVYATVDSSGVRFNPDAPR